MVRAFDPCEKNAIGGHNFLQILPITRQVSMKNRLFHWGVVVLGVISMPLTAFAQVQGQVEVSAQVVAPISVTVLRSMNFGSVVIGTGQLTLSPSGRRSVTGTVGLSTEAGSAARFEVRGTQGSAFSIAMTGSDTALRSQSTAGSPDATEIPVQWIAEVGSVPTDANRGLAQTGTLDGTGSANIHVGGILTLNAMKLADTYSGSIQVTVAYN